MTSPTPPRLERPRPPARTRRRPHPGRLLIAVGVLAVVIVLVIVAAGALLSRLGGTKNPDYTGDGSGSVVVQVAEGSTAPQIGRTLQSADVVKSAAAFQSVATKEDAKARTLQPGYYRLHKQMSAKSAFDLLLSPSSHAESKFTFPEGLSVRQALPIVSKGTGIPLAQLQAVVRNPSGLGLPSYAKGVEGFLFPATYTAAPDASATDVLKMMVTRFNQEAEQLNLVSGAKARGVTPLQLVTIASIVEREVRNDRGKAATVLYNRLKDTANFPTLGLDSTVRYALGDFPGALTQSQLETNSPYNTRKFPGLPPGPIGNPGTVALQAALQPTPGSWTYFLSLPKEDKTYYASSTAEFNELVKKLQAQGGAGGY